MNKTRNTLLRTLGTENLLHNAAQYLKVILPPLAAAAGASFFLRYANNALENYRYTWACIALLAMPFAVFALTRTVWRETLKRTARRIDLQYGSFNRMEACLELAHGNNPLREAQEEEAAKFFNEHDFHPKKRYFLIYLALASVFAGSGVWQTLAYGTFALTPEIKERMAEEAKQQNESAGDDKKIAEDKKSEAEKQAEKEKFFARLEIDSPEEEMPAKPFDLIEWTGSAAASGEIKNLRMTVYINGEKKREIPIGAESLIKNKDASLSLSGEIDLEELAPVIHDLVAYHLSAETLAPDSKEVTLISQIHFIEVKPFREEAYTANDSADMPQSGEAPLMRLPELIKKIMVQQIEVNKATFALRMAEAHPDSDIKLRREIRVSLRKSQDEIRKEALALLAAPEARLLPGDTVNQLELAVENMEKACRTIEKLFGDSKL